MIRFVGTPLFSSSSASRSELTTIGSTLTARGFGDDAAAAAATSLDAATEGDAVAPAEFVVDFKDVDAAPEEESLLTVSLVLMDSLVTLEDLDEDRFSWLDWVVRRDLGSVNGGGELIETFDEDDEEVEGGVAGIAGAETAAACGDRAEFVMFVFDCAAAAAAVGATERGGGAGVFCCCCF